MSSWPLGHPAAILYQSLFRHRAISVAGIFAHGHLCCDGACCKRLRSDTADHTPWWARDRAASPIGLPLRDLPTSLCAAGRLIHYWSKRKRVFFVWLASGREAGVSFAAAHRKRRVGDC